MAKSLSKPFRIGCCPNPRFKLGGNNLKFLPQDFEEVFLPSEYQAFVSALCSAFVSALAEDSLVGR